MKRKIFFACLVFCFAWQANTQAEFAPIGAKWYYYCHQYLAEKDAVVNGKNCREITHVKSGDLDEIMYEEDGKVYYLFDGVFRKVFDFNVEAGDIVQLELKYIASSESPIEIIAYNCLVDKVSYENVGNLQLKAVSVSFDVSFWDELSSTFDEMQWKLTYYERIGLMNDWHFLPVISKYSPAASVPLLGYQDNVLTYVNDRWVKVMGQYCDYPNKPKKIDNVKSEQLNIYPNPFNDNIFVSVNGGKNIEITDVLGKVVHCSELSNGINEISTSHFLKGIYLVRIQNKDNGIQTFKIIKP